MSSATQQVLFNTLLQLPVRAGGYDEKRYAEAGGEYGPFSQVIDSKDLPEFVRVAIVVVGPVGQAQRMEIFALGVPATGPVIVLALEEWRVSRNEWIACVSKFFESFKADYITASSEIAFGLSMLNTSWKFRSIEQLMWAMNVKG